MSWNEALPCALNREKSSHQFLSVGLRVEIHAELYRSLQGTKQESGGGSKKANLFCIFGER